MYFNDVLLLLMNRGLTKPFKAKRGIRKGDPLSPYLFVLSMEYLGIEIKVMAENSGFNYHPKCRKLDSTLIFFADDLLKYYKDDIVLL